MMTLKNTVVTPEITKLEEGGGAQVGVGSCLGKQTVGGSTNFGIATVRIHNAGCHGGEVGWD